MKLGYVYFSEMMLIEHQKPPETHHGADTEDVQAAEGFGVRGVLAEECLKQSNGAGLFIFQAGKVCAIDYQI